MNNLARSARFGPTAAKGTRGAGGATIEILVVLPVLLITLAIGVDEARMMRAAVALDNAVQMGVLAGVVKLKAVGFDKTGGPITINNWADVKSEMSNTAVADAGDYTIQVDDAEIVYRCRCPDPNTYMVGSPVSCGDSKIVNCADPMIYLQMTATTQVDMVFKVPGSEPHLILSRTAMMCGQ